MSHARLALLLVTLAECLIPRMVRAEIVVDFPPAITTGTSAQSLCVCSFVDDSAMLHWSCEPFAHSIDAESLADANLTASVTGSSGSMSATPLFASDQTDYSSGDDSADVVMTMGGSGTVNITINVAIDASKSVAGIHNTTVFLTVTSN